MARKCIFLKNLIVFFKDYLSLISIANKKLQFRNCYYFLFKSFLQCKLVQCGCISGPNCNTFSATTFWAAAATRLFLLPFLRQAENESAREQERERERDGKLPFARPFCADFSWVAAKEKSSGWHSVPPSFLFNKYVGNIWGNDFPQKQDTGPQTWTVIPVDSTPLHPYTRTHTHSTRYKQNSSSKMASKLRKSLSPLALFFLFLSCYLVVTCAFFCFFFFALVATLFVYKNLLLFFFAVFCCCHCHFHLPLPLPLLMFFLLLLSTQTKRDVGGETNKQTATRARESERDDENR